MQSIGDMWPRCWSEGEDDGLRPTGVKQDGKADLRSQAEHDRAWSQDLPRPAPEMPALTADNAVQLLPRAPAKRHTGLTITGLCKGKATTSIEESGWRLKLPTTTTYETVAMPARREIRAARVLRPGHRHPKFCGDSTQFFPMATADRHILRRPPLFALPFQPAR